MLVAPIPPLLEDTGDELSTLPESDHPPFTRSTHSQLQPFSVFWSNEKWQNLTQRRDLLECISIEEARRLGDWISGARAVRPSGVNGGQGGKTPMARTNSDERRHLREFTFNALPEDVEKTFARTRLSPRSTTDETMSAAPEGFWEPENPPYEDRSSRSDGSTDADTAGTGLESFGPDHPGPATMTIELNKPGKVMLELTKTSTPVWQVQRSGARTRMDTHTFITVTTIPRSPFVVTPPAIQEDDGEDTYMGDGATPTPETANIPLNFPVSSPETSPRIETLLVPAFPRSKPKAKVLTGPQVTKKNLANLPAGALIDTRNISDQEVTPTEEITALDLPESAVKPPSRPNQPIFFNRDGTVSGRSTSKPNRDEHGLSMDVHELLQSTDWTKTPLGPKEQWPQSLKTIGEDSVCRGADISFHGHAVPTSVLPVVG